MKKILTLFYKDLGELWASKNLMVTFFLFTALSWYYFSWMSYEFARICGQRGDTRITIENYWRFNADTSLIGDILAFNFFLLLIFLPYLMLSLLSEEKKQQWHSYFSSYSISNKEYLASKALVQFFLVAIFTLTSIILQYFTIQSVIEEPLNFSYFAMSYLIITIFIFMILSLSSFVFLKTDSLLKGLVLTYVLIIFFWLIHVPVENQQGIIPFIFKELSFSYRIEKAMEGLLRIRDIVYFSCIILFLIFVTDKALKKRTL